MLRLSFSVAVVAILLAPDMAHASEEAESSMKELRRQAAHRPRRIIYNNDGGDIDTGWNSVTPDEYLARRMEHLAGTQVDSIFWCPGITTVTIFPSQVAETFDNVISDHFKLPHRAAIVRDNVRGFMQAGRDPLAMTVVFCRRHDMELLLSYRMNDVHDAHVCPWGFSQWKRDHPEYLFGREGDNKRFGADNPRYVWSGLDYEIPEVRDYIFRIIEDACRRYDLDGLELDWLKVPMFFRPTLDLQPVERKHVKIMNDFVRRLRAMTEQVGRKRGRPLLLSCRVPRTVKHGLAVGLDVTTWLKEDLVDILTIGGGYVPMSMASEVRQMADLAHRHDVPLYACISTSGMRGELSSAALSSSEPASLETWQKGGGAIESWRGAAANIWHAGADGVYIFNFFPAKPDERFSQLGAPETLKGRDKIYAVDCLDKFFGWHEMALCLDGRLPVELRGASPTQIRLPVGEDIVANAPADKTATARLYLRLQRRASGDQVAVKLNGHALETIAPEAPLTPQPATAWVELRPDPELVKPGDNLVEVRLTTERGLTEPLVIDRLMLFVTYK